MFLASIFPFGCASQSVAVKSNDEIQFKPIPKSKYITPFDANMKTVRLALAKVTCAVAISGQKSEFEECVRSNLSELLTNCRNIQFANRVATEELQAEWKVILAGAANPKDIPKTPGLMIPEFLIKVGVSQVSRSISGKGKASDWQISINTHEEEETRQGAVQLIVEVIDIATSTNIAAYRVTGLLSDTTKSNSGNILGIGFGSSSFERIPENQAIRDACEDATSQIFETLRTRGQTPKG